MSKIKSISAVIRHSIKSTFLDYSFPTLLIFIIVFNYFSYKINDFFTIPLEEATSFSLYMVGSILLQSLVLLFYGGYLAAKFFAKELEDETMQPLFMIRSGRTVVYIGKMIAGIILIGTASVLIFTQNYLTLRSYGIVSFLTMGWIAKLSFIGFISGLFLYLSSTIVGVISKKVLTTMLFTSFYTLGSFFIVFTEVNSLDYSIKIKSTLFFFPFSSIQYMDFCIEHQGTIDNILTTIPIFSVISLTLISYFLIKEVNI